MTNDFVIVSAKEGRERERCGDRLTVYYRATQKLVDGALIRG